MAQRPRFVLPAVVAAVTLALAACSSPAQKAATAPATVAVSLNAHENVVVTPGPPLPSLPPLTREQRLVLKWRRNGWFEVASAAHRSYMEHNSGAGLQAVDTTQGVVIWRNPHCRPVGAAVSILGSELFTACTPEHLTVLSADDGHVLRTAALPMYGVNRVVPAGKEWLAVQGWDDGAAIVNRLVIVRRDTLEPITRKAITDGTFLGVIGDLAYIDDWCCNGRADEYRPATVYWISLRDGKQGEPIDLRPDPDQHPANLQPIGQGEHNYMRGRYLYVPVGDVVYRYDVFDLRVPPYRIH